MSGPVAPSPPPDLPLVGPSASSLPSATSARPARDGELMGEFIGARLTVHHAPGWTPLPFEGVVVDETRNTLRVVPLTGGAPRTLQKRGLEGTFAWDGHAIRFKGDELRHRPEDRIKRLAPTGRSRRP